VIDELKNYNQKVYSRFHCSNLSEVKRMIWDIGTINDDLIHDISNLNEEI
jgi:hypothetical protein